MTVMPSLRLTPQDAADIATYLLTQKKQEPSAYPEAAFMTDPNLEGRKARNGFVTTVAPDVTRSQASKMKAALVRS